VLGAAVVVDLPLVGGAALMEARARAVSHKLEAVAGGSAVAREVGDDVAVGLSLGDDEQVIAILSLWAMVSLPPRR
jgi:hypothetical protein